MVDVITQIDISVSLEIVSQYASDPDKAPIWYVNIKSASWKSAKPIAIGSLVAFYAKFLRRILAYNYEFVQLIPNHKLVMGAAEGLFAMETTFSWE
jgi:hypothetical protein